jgi:carbamoyl-phosphate synthase large subunit
VPFIAKATGLSLAKIAARCMAGETLVQQGLVVDGIPKEVIPPYYAVKRPVFPFNKFPGVDPILGPEMRSTGEVMGIGSTFGEAFFKGQCAVGDKVPHGGRVFISVRDADKERAVSVAEQFRAQGFTIVATRRTASVLQAAGVPCEIVNKVTEGRPHIVDMIKNDQISFVINTTEGAQAIADSVSIRCTAVQHKVSYVTTLAGGEATCAALAAERHITIRRLQDLHERLV